MALDIFDAGGLEIFGNYWKGATLDTMVVKGTWTASETWTIPTLTLDGTVTGAAQVLSNLGNVFVGDTANPNMTLGVTITKATGVTDQYIALKHADVATGLTTIVTGSVETDDIAAFSPLAAATGGLLVQVLGENAVVTSNLVIESYGGQADTTKSTAGRALTEIYVSQHDGANALANIAADGNVFGVRARVGAADVMRWMVDEDGDTWQAGGITVGGDITTDRWLSQASNTFFGVGVVGAGNLAHVVGSDGYQNSIFGSQSGYSLTTGSNDSFFGIYSGYTATTAYNSCVFGYASGYLVTTGSGLSLFGYQAGYDLTTATTTTCIGYAAGNHVSQLATAVNSMALGANSYTDASNQVVIGDANVTALLFRGSITISATTLLTLNAFTLGGDITGGANNITMTGSISATGARILKSWHTNITSTNAVTVDSSATVKEDIRPYAGDALSILRDMEVITFRHEKWLDPSSRVKMGIKSETVRESLALSPIQRENGDEYMGINIYGLMSLNSRAIQMLDEKMEAVEEANRILRHQLSEAGVLPKV